MNEQIRNSTCQLCGSTADLSIYLLSPAGIANNEIATCPACLSELVKREPDGHYWRFLAEAMWSDILAVQVLAWRILTLLSKEAWAADLLDLLYLDDDLLAWAKIELETDQSEATEIHRDSLGNELQAGDTVMLTRSLDVKGSSLNAKMGTVVKHIRLVTDNTDQIEGKIDGQTIIILTKYLRKQNN